MSCWLMTVSKTFAMIGRSEMGLQVAGSVLSLAL